MPDVDAYPLGATVRYIDGMSHVASGTVNGAPLGTNGKIDLVPVWTEHYDGHKAALVYVSPAMILNVAP
jgi:hypothetical protein